MKADGGPLTNPPLRVLQVVLSLNPGGTERLVIQLCHRLNREIPTAVCCLDAPGDWATEVQAAGIPLTALGRRPGFHPSLSRGVAAAASAHQATVIHAHHYSPFVYSGMVRLWKPRLGVVFTEHGRLSDAGPSMKRRTANGLLGRPASRVFAVSHDVGRHLSAEGFPNVEVIYNGVDMGPVSTAESRERVRRELGISPGEFLVGTIARLDPVKDLGTLLNACALLRGTRPIALMVVGDGPERASLEQMADALGIRDHVRFLGQRGNAREWVAGCDAYVNSSISEGVSLTILEAMAAKLPVVVTAVGGTPEVVDNTCGRLVPARDHVMMAAALSDLAAAPDTRATLGEAGRHRVQTRFTLDRMVAEYADVYRQVASHGGQPSGH